MKPFYIIILLTFFGCVNKPSYCVEPPEHVIINGRVLNHNKNNHDTNISFSINPAGFPIKMKKVNMDSSGYFYLSFDSYVPTDIRLSYKSYIDILTHPGDSIYLTIDGNIANRTDLLNAIQFSGSAKKLNHEAAIFQNLWYSQSFSNFRAMKSYDLQRFERYLDTIKKEQDSLYNKFIQTHNPTEEARQWAYMFNKMEYYNLVVYYPKFHRIYNNLNEDEWSVPEKYYDKIDKALPINESQLICGYRLSTFLKGLREVYLSFASVQNSKEITNKTKHEIIEINGFLWDSLIINEIIRFTSDDFTKHLLLTDFFSHELEKYDFKSYERYEDLLTKNMKNPLLYNSLTSFYSNKYEEFQDKNEFTSKMLNNLNVKTRTIIDSIFQKNEGKIMNLIMWAPWCSPCRAKIPKINQLAKKLPEKKVSFVFICLSSDRKQWKSAINELNIEGQHYFLDTKQSNDLRRAFYFNGFPTQIIFDQKGIIYKPDVDMHEMKGQIMQLLKP